jgi:riboflavin synthase
MFTGIVTAIGTVCSAEQRGDLRLIIACDYDMTGVALGASIACSGTCLTVVDKGPDWFAVDVSAETVSCTAKGLWKQGSRLNLERALRLGDELGGHLVTGHVDAVARVVEASREGASTRLTIDVSADLGPMIAPKGSITLDGASLTVNEVEDLAAVTRFWVNLIPHTGQQTTFGDIAPERELNVEIDVLARYLKRMTSRV